MESPEYRKMSRTKLFEILIKQSNPNARKSVVVDVESEDEVDEAYDKITRENLPLKKWMSLWKANNYSRTDPKFRKHKR